MRIKPLFIFVLLALGFAISVSVSYAGAQDGMAYDNTTILPANNSETDDPNQGGWQVKCLDFDNVSQGTYVSITSNNITVYNNYDDIEVVADNPGGRFSAPHTALPTFYAGSSNRNIVEVPAGTQAVQVTIGDYGYDEDVYNLSCYNSLNSLVVSTSLDVGDAPGGFNLRVMLSGNQDITHCEFWSEGTNSNSAFFDNVCVGREID